MTWRPHLRKVGHVRLFISDARTSLSRPKGVVADHLRVVGGREAGLHSSRPVIIVHDTACREDEALKLGL